MNNIVRNFQANREMVGEGEQCAPQRIAIVDQELRQLEKTVDTLGELVKLHASKIAPILRMEPAPTRDEKNATEPSTSVALADRISTSSRRLTAITQALNGITSLVEV